MKKVAVAFGISILLIVIYIFSVYKEDEYSENLFYMDTYISVKLITTESKAKKALKDIDEIFKKYDSITDRYKESELSNINNVVGTYSISNELRDVLKENILWYEKSNHLFNFNIGNLVDVWKKYRENKNGVPKEGELDVDIDVQNIQLNGNQVTVNNANIDLGASVKGIVTKIIGQYLEDAKIINYIINAGGNVIVGNKINQYKIGIENPDGGLLKTIKVNNKCIVTSGGSERFYEYNGIKYHHIIDPNTKFPANHMKSVTIISEDCAKADFMSTTLFLMDIESGKAFAKENNVDVIWYSLDNKMVETEGINKYE